MKKIVNYGRKQCRFLIILHDKKHYRNICICDKYIASRSPYKLSTSKISIKPVFIVLLFVLFFLLFFLRFNSSSKASKNFFRRGKEMDAYIINVVSCFSININHHIDIYVIQTMKWIKIVYFNYKCLCVAIVYV